MYNYRRVFICFISLLLFFVCINNGCDYESDTTVKRDMLSAISGIETLSPDPAIEAISENNTDIPEKTCISTKQPQKTAEPTNTPKPDYTPELTETPSSKAESTHEQTKKAESTPKPTKTPKPKATPKPTKKPKQDQASGNAGNAKYVLNKNTHVFHKLSFWCIKKMSEKNKIYYSGTRTGAIKDGYRPCKKCHP